MKDMTITAGRVYAGMSKIVKAKQELKNKLQEIYSDPKLSDEGKTSEEAFWKGKYDESCSKVKADMEDALTELQNMVVTDQFIPSNELTATIDFLETMKMGGCLSDRIIDEQLSKFRGQEMNLIYMREKLKKCIGTDVFDKFTFSGYSRADIDKPSQFIPPTAYFVQLREAMNREDTTLTAYMMDELESKLGIESAEGKTYRTERQANIDARSTPQLI